MRHWLWYKTDGEIGGEITRGGGFDGGQDFNDAGSADPDVVTARAIYTGLAGFSAFLAYDCACDPGDVWCDCARQQTINKCVDTDTLVNKAIFEIVLDDVVVASGSQTDKVPSATVTLKLREEAGSSIPNGTVVEARNTRGVDLLQTSPQNLTFTAGETNQINLKAPAQGQAASLWLKPVNQIDCLQAAVKVRGWA